MTKVAVYGSLRYGFYNHHLIEHSEYLGEATTLPAFTMINLGGFPGVVGMGTASIKCELYSVSDKVLKRLDQLESHPNFYVRTMTSLKNMENKEVLAHIYLLPGDWLTLGNLEVIKSGDWKLREAA